ncbi:MAG: hypothetical protein ABF893_12985, partial [Gluconacetobacter liquefaciens]
SIHDTIYFPGGVNYAYRPSGGYSGVLPQGSFTWRATRHVTFSIDGQYTALSRGLRDAGAKPGAYFQTNLELTF